MLRWLRISFLIIFGLGVALFFTAVSVGSNSAIFERYFPLLLIVNLFVALTLFAFVTAIAVRMFQRWKSGVFGAKMAGRLALTMSFVAVVPCLLIYLVSHQFIGRSIDSWFDVRIEQALDSGVTLSGEVINSEQSKLRAITENWTKTLEKVDEKEINETLHRLRETGDIASAAILDAQGELEISALKAGAPIPDLPTRQEMRNALAQGVISVLDGEQEDAGQQPLRIRSLTPIYLNNRVTAAYLQLSQPIPDALARNATDLVNGYRNYQELILARTGLRSIYSVTLTLTLLLAALGSIALALVFAKSITAPVAQLAVGTRKVAEGDLRPIKEFSGSNEINALTKSFNSMVAQIADARESVENQRAATERARASLERVLSNISSGVLVMDEELHVDMTNNGANTILKNPLLRPGISIAAIEPELGHVLSDAIQVAETDIRLETTISRPDSDNAPLTIFIRGSRIDSETGVRWIVVFDDISVVLDAQRAMAWGEVARRLAHEIKNPLTPIRLAAERLDIKLGGKLDEKDTALLHRTTSTIINQVDAMKQMVNDFRDYAKLPNATLEPLDLTALLDELISLYITAGSPLVAELDRTLPGIMGDTTQLRQVIHNLISNAVDAIGETDNACIRVITEPTGYSSAGTPRAIRLRIEDNGPGFSPSILSKAFEPYTTTKASGTGLGLPMVKKIVEEHHAKILISNLTDDAGNIRGASVSMVFPIPGKVENQ